MRCDTSQVTGQHVELLLEKLRRFDGLISETNIKGTLLLPYYCVVFGGVAIGWDRMEQFHGTNTLWALSICGLIVIILSATIYALVQTLRAIMPFRDGSQSKDPAPATSHFFFGHVARFDSGEQYLSAVSSCTQAQVALDLATQVHTLAHALGRKFDLLGRAISATLWCQVPAIVMFLLLSTLERVMSELK